MARKKKASRGHGRGQPARAQPEPQIQAQAQEEKQTRTQPQTQKRQASTPQHSTIDIQPDPRQKTTLTTLPPELRYKIYDYLFTLYRVEVTQKTKQRENRLSHTRLRPRNPNSQLSPPETKHRPDYPPLPYALVLSCKTVYRETVLRLYSQTQFSFRTTRALSRFLHTTPRSTLETALYHIELTQTMYHEPRLLAFRIFKHRADLAFYSACEDLAVRCRALRVLHVELRVGDWPVRMEVGERWSWPLLVFEKVGNRVQWARVRLSVPGWKGDRLEGVEREVERSVLGDEAFRAREVERERVAREGRVRAGKVLRVVF